MLSAIVNGLDDLVTGLKDTQDLLEMAAVEDDEELVNIIKDDIKIYNLKVEDLEFKRMFSGEMDANNAYLDIQCGAGGTEAQDWADILLRMYLRWCDKHGWKTELIKRLREMWRV